MDLKAMYSNIYIQQNCYLHIFYLQFIFYIYIGILKHELMRNDNIYKVTADLYFIQLSFIYRDTK